MPRFFESRAVTRSSFLDKAPRLPVIGVRLRDGLLIHWPAHPGRTKTSSRALRVCSLALCNNIGAKTSEKSSVQNAGSAQGFSKLLAKHRLATHPFLFLHRPPDPPW